MAYTHTNYRTAKALREDFKAGKTITCYQPGFFGPDLEDGDHVIEMPHYPEPHRAYVGVTVKDGVIVKVKK